MLHTVELSTSEVLLIDFNQLSAVVLVFALDAEEVFNVFLTATGERQQSFVRLYHAVKVYRSKVKTVVKLVLETLFLQIRNVKCSAVIVNQNFIVFQKSKKRKKSKE